MLLSLVYFAIRCLLVARGAVRRRHASYVTQGLLEIHEGIPNRVHVIVVLL